MAQSAVLEWFIISFRGERESYILVVTIRYHKSSSVIQLLVLVNVFVWLLLTFSPLNKSSSA